MESQLKRITCMLMLLAIAATSALATVTLHALFSDNMVLQRDAPVPVWGWAAPKEQITVSLDRQALTTVTGDDGCWMVKLAPMKAGGPYGLTVTGTNTVTLKNVMFGEVWVASGQSNMEVSVRGTLNWEKEVATADYPNIRMFTVKTLTATFPQQNVSGSWIISTPQTAPSFSAAAFYFARELYKKLNVPIGVIHSSVGGTLAEAWTRPEAMVGVPELAPIFQRTDDAAAKYQQGLVAYAAQLKAWETAVAQAQAENKPAPKKPTPPEDPANQSATHPGSLFNGKIAPLIPYRIKGVIWWQGEYNSERCEQYKTLFPILIRDWRRVWGQGDFPFIFVQLENYDIQPQPNPAHYDEMREAQMYTFQTVPNTGIVTAVDIGDAHDVHMPNKPAVGLRLANYAAATAYGIKDIIPLGPIYKSAKVESDKIRITFTHTDGGLVVKGGMLTGFTIAAEDKKFVPAEAKLDGNTVVVWSTAVKKPVAVRYAWNDNPTCALYNTGELPAFPFRTDDWPLPTDGKF